MPPSDCCGWNTATAGGKLFFNASDGRHGRELWTSDGTRAGTKLVKDILPGSDDSDPTWFSDPTWLTKGPGGRIFFFSDFTELWKSDGTRAGTKLVKALRYSHSSLDEATRVGRLLFFTLNHGDHLWRTDGTRSGTKRIKRSVRSPGNLTNVNGTLFFTEPDRDHGRELWKSDGTGAGTKLVKDVLPGPASGSPGRLRSFFGKLFFTADDGVHGRELWKSDGTRAGTRLFRDIDPGSKGSSPRALARVGRRFVFSVWDGVSDSCQLWKSDGTRSGTNVVRGNAGCPTPVWGTTTVAGTLFFAATDGGVWRSDGTRAGTRRVLTNLEQRVEDPRSFTGAGGTLFFAGGYSFPGDELWKVVP